MECSVNIPFNYYPKEELTKSTYSRANDRVTGERTGVQGSSHSGSGFISSGAGLPEAKST